MEAPPKAGPGSSQSAWADHAAQVTGTPRGQWDDVPRDDIIAQLEGDGPGPGTTFRFVSLSPRKRVYRPDGTEAARFVDGRFETDDPEVAGLLEPLPDVRRES